MSELLLELLSEEIPARMQRRAIEDLTGLLRDKLAEAETPASELRGYVTPRRLAVIAEGIPQTQPDRTEERRGPRVGSPPQAIEGFLRSAGLGSIEECEIRDTGRGEFYFAVVKRSGRPAAAVLSDLIKAAIAELPWPKSMRWPGSPLRWVRPLTSVICLFDGQVVPLALDGVPVGRTTCGHRFLSPGEFCANSAAEYLEKLQRAYVVLDQEQRRELIRADLERRASELGVNVKPDPGLLDEVTGLAEFPVVLASSIDTGFMSLPPEVLQTAMRVHQKYFSCVYSDGRPTPHFLFVANNLAEDGGKTIIAGNERVLRARLADARFFWDQDRKIRLEDRVEALKDRVYHDKLGNLFDKAERIELLSEFLVEYVANADRRLAQRAASLAKADLSSGMVGEFPELQGIMGSYYYAEQYEAGNDGLRKDLEIGEVAIGIREHYKPLGPDDTCPTTPTGIVVSLADKIDTLFAFFWINEKPSGSRDPFALRRAAQGVIRIILENNIRLPLTQAFRCEHSIFVRHQMGNPRYHGVGPFVTNVTAEVTEFIADRLKVHLREEGVRHDLIAAVFALDEDDLVRLRARVSALQNFLNTDYGSHLLTAYRRASNIVRIEERRDSRSYDRDPDRNLMWRVEETNLDDVLTTYGQFAQNYLEAEQFPEAMVSLASLKYPVDEFFDKITVNTDEPKLRENRLRLLARIRDTMNRVADFSLIEG
jgi:glycyl-tRNA synthetase beta chain